MTYVHHFALQPFLMFKNVITPFTQHYILRLDNTHGNDLSRTYDT